MKIEKSSSNKEKMKCVTCELDFDYYDESEQCLHCWCISNNMSCECMDEEGYRD